ESYHSVIARTVTEPLRVEPSQVHGPEAPDDATEVSINYYDEKITAAGDIDLQLLGIGRNGHIGFNEPGTPFDSPTHIAQLTELTREDNSRFFEGGIDEVTQLAVTQGIGTILQSRKAVLMVFGEAKSESIRASLDVPYSTTIPGYLHNLTYDLLLTYDATLATTIKRYIKT